MPDEINSISENLKEKRQNSDSGILLKRIANKVVMKMWPEIGGNGRTEKSYISYL
jgi:hypothetical protein